MDFLNHKRSKYNGILNAFKMNTYTGFSAGLNDNVQ